MKAARGLGRAVALAALGLCAAGLQGCGVLSVSHAGYLEHTRLRAENGPAYSTQAPPPPPAPAPCPGTAGATDACPRERVIVRLPPPRSVPSADLPNPLRQAGIEHAHSSAALAPVLLPMAYLSNLVYHRHERTAHRTDPARACGDGHEPHPMGARLLALPAPAATTAAAPHGQWRRWGSAEDHCTAEAGTGLFYDTYLRLPDTDEPASAPLQVALVFRGTENDFRQFGFDWTDNALSVFGISPHQYRRAIERLAVTVAALRAAPALQGRPLHLYAAGHSLGGGLAQQAAYLHADIRAVYAFNTSSVTNWSQLRLWDGGRHIQNHEPVIVRAEQDREALDYLRGITTRFNLTRFHRTDLQFHFGRYGPFTGHSIAKLSCHLAARAAEPPTDPARPLFGPAAAQARAVLNELGQPEVGCDAATLAEICENSPYLQVAAQVCRSRLGVQVGAARR